MFRKNFQILQQNSYLIRNQLGYIFDNYISLFLPYNKNSKKKIAYTSRVKRLIFTTSLLLLIALFFIVLTFVYIHFLLAILFALLTIMLYPFIVVISTLINMPIEFFIKKYYIGDVKKILKKHKGLIKIGITGSYGKTSIKNFLYQVLSEKYSVLMTPQSYNTPMGITKTIREELKATHEIFIVEMGADHKGDIKTLCKIVDPDYGIISSIGSSHLNTFKTKENIIRTKFELAKYVEKKGENRVVLNCDDENIKNNAGDLSFSAYGLNDEKFNLVSYLRAVNINVSLSGISFDIENNKHLSKGFSANVLGKHNVLNLLSVISLSLSLGLSFDEVKRGLVKIKPVPHRLELIKKDGLRIIDDAFNSNIVGFKTALDVLEKFEQIRILLTPGMVELGGSADEEHFEIGMYARNKIDYAILIGENRTLKIYEGLVKNKFDLNKIFIVNDLNEGLSKIKTIKGEKIVLIENDLPDVYS